MLPVHVRPSRNQHAHEETVANVGTFGFAPPPLEKNSSYESAVAAQLHCLAFPAHVLLTTLTLAIIIWFVIVAPLDLGAPSGVCLLVLFVMTAVSAALGLAGRLAEIFLRLSYDV